MTTPDDVRKQIQATNEYLETNIDPFGILETYITQQEKVSKLLVLIKKERSMLERCINGNYQPVGEHANIIKQIKALEKEITG